MPEFIIILKQRLYLTAQTSIKTACLHGLVAVETRLPAVPSQAIHHDLHGPASIMQPASPKRLDAPVLPFKQLDNVTTQQICMPMPCAQGSASLPSLSDPAALTGRCMAYRTSKMCTYSFFLTRPWATKAEQQARSEISMGLMEQLLGRRPQDWQMQRPSAA